MAGYWQAADTNLSHHDVTPIAGPAVTFASSNNNTPDTHHLAMKNAVKNLLSSWIRHITAPDGPIVGCCGEPAETCACPLPCICGSTCPGLGCDRGGGRTTSVGDPAYGTFTNRCVRGGASIGSTSW